MLQSGFFDPEDRFGKLNQFFKMLRSMRVSASSRLSLETSASRSLTGRRLPSIAPSFLWRALTTIWTKSWSISKDGRSPRGSSIPDRSQASPPAHGTPACTSVWIAFPSSASDLHYIIRLKTSTSLDLVQLSGSFSRPEIRL